MTRNLLPNAAQMEEATCPVYFLHIPKTAGTTFHNYVTLKFGPEKVCPAHLWHQMLQMNPVEVAKYGFIWGHFYSYLYKYVPSPMRYLTFIRHPIERAISHYGHIMLHPGHYFHRRAHELGDFSSFLRDPEMATMVTNFQVRALAIDLDPVRVAATLSPKELDETGLERKLETTLPQEEPEILLKTAIDRLEQMCFVGITERFEESLVLLSRKFNWMGPHAVESKNINQTRLKADQISSSDMANLIKMNELDFALYETAVRHFEREFSA